VIKQDNIIIEYKHDKQLPYYVIDTHVIVNVIILFYHIIHVLVHTS